MGLVTVKDVLRHEAIAHHRSSTPRPPPTPSSATARGGPGHSRDSSQSWAGWTEHEEWQEIDVDIRGNGLEYALEVGLGWIRKQIDGVRGRTGMGSMGGGGIGRRRDPTDNPAYEYELSGDRPT